MTSSFSWRLLLLLCLLLYVGCRRESRDADEFFNQQLYSPTYAEGFSIMGREGRQSVVLSVTNPWQGADEVASGLLILRGDESAPEGFEGQILHGDAHRIVAMSSTHIALLDALAEAGRVVGVSGLRYVATPSLRARKKEIADVGYEGNVNYESLIGAAPDLVLLYGVSGASNMEKKLTDLGIPYIYIGDYLEESPLGKAEWLVALGEITGHRKKGEEAFVSIARRYEELKTKIAERGGRHPKVMVNVPYGDAWYMPSSTSYMARLISDAGGDYLYHRDTGNASLPIGMEEAYLTASQADVWINLDLLGSIGQLKTHHPRFADVKSVATGRVYNNTLRSNEAGGNDFYESGIVNPDLILEDLASIFHPEQSGGKLHYYKQLR